MLEKRQHCFVDELDAKARGREEHGVALRARVVTNAVVQELEAAGGELIDLSGKVARPIPIVEAGSMDARIPKSSGGTLSHLDLDGTFLGVGEVHVDLYSLATHIDVQGEVLRGVPCHARGRLIWAIAASTSSTMCPTWKGLVMSKLAMPDKIHRTCPPPSGRTRVRSSAMGRVDGKVALVTGAAQGLGRADAETLAREGAKVMLTDVNDESGQATADAIVAAGGEASYMHQDVADEDQWVSTMQAMRDTYGRLDVLVNNAGLVIPETPDQCSLETFRKQNAVMNEGTFLGCQNAMPLMAEGGGGSIINMSSIASHLGYPVFFAYSAAKGAIRAMTKAIAIHCQTEGMNIRCNSLHPGGIDTPMIDMTSELLGLEDKSDLSPVGLGDPQDVANMILFLASDESKFISGGEFLVDNALYVQ